MRIVVSNLRESFRLRLAEWMLAVIMMLWGVVLSLDYQTFASSASYGLLNGILSEEGWGRVGLIAGAIRLAALAINGAFRPMAHLRCFLSISTGLFWLQITFSLLQSGNVSTGLAVYPAFVVVEIINAVRAAADAGKADGHAYSQAKAIDRGGL